MTIDWWTLGLQTVNVAVLAWLLGRFFWRPVSAMIEQRRAAIAATLAAADKQRSEAAAALAEIAATRTGFAQERDAILAAAQAAAEKIRTERLDQAAQDAAALAAGAKTAIEQEKAATDKNWADRASQLAVDIATRLASRLQGSAVNEAFLDWLVTAIRALPEAARQSVAGGGALEAVSATPVAPADQARYRAAIAQAFAADPQISFKVDGDLVAGLELHGPDFTVSNSWRADLTRIRVDLTHDAQS